jgi:hypothetical protein
MLLDAIVKKKQRFLYHKMLYSKGEFWVIGK